MRVCLDDLISSDIAVNCKTEEEAKQLLEILIDIFPNQTNCWSKDRSHWGLYGRDTCYSMYQEKEVSMPRRLVYSPVHFFNDIGYRVVSFADLFLQAEDLGDIVDHDGIEFLFGAEEESV